MDPPPSLWKLPYNMDGPISLEKTKTNKVLHIFYNVDDKHSRLLPVILAYIQECPFCQKIPVFISRIVVASGSGDVTIMALLRQWNWMTGAVDNVCRTTRRFFNCAIILGWFATPATIIIFDISDVATLTTLAGTRPVSYRKKRANESFWITPKWSFWEISKLLNVFSINHVVKIADCLQSTGQE